MLEAAIPDQLAPKSAISGMIDVLEEMPVHFFVNAIEHLCRINHIRNFTNRALLGEDTSHYEQDYHNCQI